MLECPGRTRDYSLSSQGGWLAQGQQKTSLAVFAWLGHSKCVGPASRRCFRVTDLRMKVPMVSPSCVPASSLSGQPQRFCLLDRRALHSRRLSMKRSQGSKRGSNLKTSPLKTSSGEEFASLRSGGRVRTVRASFPRRSVGTKLRKYTPKFCDLPQIFMGRFESEIYAKRPHRLLGRAVIGTRFS